MVFIFKPHNSLPLQGSAVIDKSQWRCGVFIFHPHSSLPVALPWTNSHCLQCALWKHSVAALHTMKVSSHSSTWPRIIRSTQCKIYGITEPMHKSLGTTRALQILGWINIHQPHCDSNKFVGFAAPAGRRCFYTGPTSFSAEWWVSSYLVYWFRRWRTMRVQMIILIVNICIEKHHCLVPSFVARVRFPVTLKKKCCLSPQLPTFIPPNYLMVFTDLIRILQKK